MKLVLAIVASSLFLASTALADGAGTAVERYDAALKAHVNGAGLVNYKALKADSSDLDAYLQSVGDLTPTTYAAWSEAEKISFWVNVYNAYTLKAIITNYPIKSSFFKSALYPKNSIRQISGVWDGLEWSVMGRKLTLDHIEHQEIRAKFNEPRVHAALVCAALSCPPLRNEAYRGDALEAQLDDQMRDWLADPTKFKIDRRDATVYLSQIFDWFGGDFVAKFGTAAHFAGFDETERAVLNAASQYVSEADAEYMRTADIDLDYLSYDWTLNEQP